MLKIGHTVIEDHPILLAPMEDLTDPSFRYICKMYGADMMYTEFISSDGLIRDGKKSVKKLEIYDYERPIGIQLYGHIPDSMVEAAKIAEIANPELIDLNFGCPVRKIARRGAGAGMMRDVPLMIEITKKVVEATSLPVSVKTRLGWDESNKNILDITLRLQDVGIQAITIHGRTGIQLYKGKADWTLIGEVKNHPGIHIPVIGNGDVDHPVRAKEMFDRYGVDAIMIGRAAIGKPWIFRDIKHYLKTGEILPPPSVQERVDLARLHQKKSLEHKGESRGLYEMRRHFSNYFKGLPDFKQLRLKLVTSTDLEEIHHILDTILEKYRDFDDLN
ncbi:MAG: tRNA dihydrouridine synthase DusB [Bacteroidales bacterium]|nr:tRNA dihydrouridine synthase DusB [Bacteroidales bacterium]